MIEQRILCYAFAHGYFLFKITDSGAEEVYHNQSLFPRGFPGAANVVSIGDFLYGYAGPWKTPAMICLDPNTGDVKWKHEKVGGAFLAAGNKLLFQSVTGSLVMCEATPDAYKELGSVPVLTGQCWTAPSLANGLVYCRNTAGDVVCLDFNGK